MPWYIWTSITASVAILWQALRVHYRSHYVYFVVSCDVSLKESGERSEGRDSHNHPALHQVLSHFHDFSKLHKDVPPPSGLRSLMEITQWAEPSLQLYMEKNPNAAQAATGSNFKGPNFISHHTPGSKKKKRAAFIQCNFIARGFIGCPLVRPLSGTVPNLGVGVGWAGVKMLCLTSLSWSVVFWSAAVVIRHWTHVGAGKRQLLSWQFLSIFMMTIKGWFFSLKRWATTCSRFRQLFYILRFKDGWFLVVVHERSSYPSVLKSGLAT